LEAVFVPIIPLLASLFIEYDFIEMTRTTLIIHQ
jgi:hypothetical protein